MVVRPIVVVSLLALAMACLSSCGGGGGDASAPERTTTFSSLASFDGYIIWPGSISAAGAAVDLGDTFDNSWTWGFYRFEHASLPFGATVIGASLRVYQFQVTGTPYSDLSHVYVDHVDLGSGLDASDMASTALTSDVGTISVDATLGYKTLDVTAQVKADLSAARITSDFRLAFWSGTNANDAPDFARFTDAEDLQGIGSPPELVVTWR